MIIWIGLIASSWRITQLILIYGRMYSRVQLKEWCSVLNAELLIADGHYLICLDHSVTLLLLILIAETHIFWLGGRPPLGIKTTRTFRMAAHHYFLTSF
jgi:hypothetical protein